MLLLLIFIVGSCIKEVVSENPSSLNCTWKFIEQPLSHFQRSEGGYYKQRLCVYDEYWKPSASLPVFLYTGNESPVEEYVNSTGLIWDLAKKMNALIVFAEHRYFGESIPEINGMENCLSYLTSEEALADYASLCNTMRREWGVGDASIIAFGGSYGGMLSSWLRIVYPTAVDGAIAASAPVWGFPLQSCPLDGSAKAVSYAASPAAGCAPHCADNLKAAYVLLTEIAKTSEGRAALSESMDLCSPLQSEKDIESFLQYLQTPLFDLSEGSYPFPSSYITFALTGTDAQLPPWAMQVMCESLAGDYGIQITGDTQAVAFTVRIGEVEVNVDWDKTEGNGYTQNQLQESGALELASAAARSIQLWYNVTGTMESCIDWSTAAPNAPHTTASQSPAHIAFRNGLRELASKTTSKHAYYSEGEVEQGNEATDKKTKCTADQTAMDAMTAWNTLCCNDGINLINPLAQGVGNDLYWPPNQPKGFTKEQVIPGSLDYCVYLEALGLYGVPSKRDDWSKWMDTVYGGERLQYVTNIVYTNGNLDPWSPAGVLSASKTVNPSIETVVIDMGGHHLDLFWPTANDPDSALTARAMEEKSIRKWIEEKQLSASRQTTDI